MYVEKFMLGQNGFQSLSVKSLLFHMYGCHCTGFYDPPFSRGWPRCLRTLSPFLVTMNHTLPFTSILLSFLCHRSYVFEPSSPSLSATPLPSSFYSMLNCFVSFSFSSCSFTSFVVLPLPISALYHHSVCYLFSESPLCFYSLLHSISFIFLRCPSYC